MSFHVTVIWYKDMHESCVVYIFTVFDGSVLLSLLYCSVTHLFEAVRFDTCVHFVYATTTCRHESYSLEKELVFFLTC